MQASMRCVTEVGANKRCGVPAAPVPGCSAMWGGEHAAPPCSAGPTAPTMGLSGTPATSPAPMLATSRLGLGLGLGFGDLAAAGGAPACALPPAAAAAPPPACWSPLRPAQRPGSRCARGRSPWLSAHAPGLGLGLGLGPAPGSARGARAASAAGARCSAACRCTCLFRLSPGPCAGKDMF